MLPTRRSTAEAIQILISHALGDAGSPYLIGIVSCGDRFRGSNIKFHIICFSLQVSDFLRNELHKTDAVCDPDMKSLIPILGGPENVSNRTVCHYTVDFYSMQYSLFINNVVEVIGGLFFLLTAIYIVRDKMRCDKFTAGKDVRIPAICNVFAKLD